LNLSPFTGIVSASPESDPSEAAIRAWNGFEHHLQMGRSASAGSFLEHRKEFDKVSVQIEAN
jgi:hypothetical protein